MYKLLRAGYARLFRMKSFYIGIALMIFYPVMSNIDSYSSMKNDGYVYWFEESLWVFGTFMALIMAVVVHVFIGRDFADKTIRNKLIVGHTKEKYFLAIC